MEICGTITPPEMLNEIFLYCVRSFDDVNRMSVVCKVFHRTLKEFNILKVLFIRRWGEYSLVDDEDIKTQIKRQVRNDIDFDPNSLRFTRVTHSKEPRNGVKGISSDVFEDYEKCPVYFRDDRLHFPSEIAKNTWFRGNNIDFFTYKPSKMKKDENDNERNFFRKSTDYEHYCIVKYLRGNRDVKSMDDVETFHYDISNPFRNFTEDDLPPSDEKTGSSSRRGEEKIQETIDFSLIIFEEFGDSIMRKVTEAETTKKEFPPSFSDKRTLDFSEIIHRRIKQFALDGLLGNYNVLERVCEFLLNYFYELGSSSFVCCKKRIVELRKKHKWKFRDSESTNLTLDEVISFMLEAKRIDRYRLLSQGPPKNRFEKVSSRYFRSAMSQENFSRNMIYLHKDDQEKHKSEEEEEEEEIGDGQDFMKLLKRSRKGFWDYGKFIPYEENKIGKVIQENEYQWDHEEEQNLKKWEEEEGGVLFMDEVFMYTKKSSGIPMMWGNEKNDFLFQARLVVTEKGVRIQKNLLYTAYFPGCPLT